MVTYDDILNVIMVETGQYISDLTATLLDQPKVELMIQRELGLYSRYKPNKVTTYGTLYNQKTFDLTIDGFVPDSIVDIRTDRFVPAGIAITPIPGPVHSYHWRYDKPVLYFRYPQGEYIYSYIVPHKYVNNAISSIEIHDRFINLVVGRFLMSVGKSRRAFTIDEIPINTDASEMISEGKELYDSTMEEIRINSAFSLAVLV